MRLELDVERDSYVAGEAVTGSVRTPEGGRARRIEVVLELREHGGSYDAVAWATRARLAADEELADGWSAPFVLALPDDAMPSVRSPNGALTWCVRAAADVRGRDPSTERAIAVRRRA